MKILIICTGNSCRSQMAEGFLRVFDSNLEVFSAGTRPEKNVNPNAVKVMKEAGIDISSHSPNHIDDFSGISFDYVITVCDNAKAECPVFPGDADERLHFGFDDPASAKGTNEEILDFYRQIRDEIQSKFSDFYLTRIIKARK